MNHSMRRKWHDLLRASAVDPTLANDTFEDICKQYSGSGRFYHTLDHVQNVLETVECLGSLAKHLDAVKLAAWLHDVIYDSRASNNEERSAEYAKRVCKKLAIQDGSLIAYLILKTKTHDAGEDADTQVLIDADFAILGAGRTDYRAYAENIRREYAWVPEPQYRKARRRVLKNFLDRVTIYHFLRDLEEPARRNIAAEIAQLDS